MHFTSAHKKAIYAVILVYFAIVLVPLFLALVQPKEARGELPSGWPQSVNELDVTLHNGLVLAASWETPTGRYCTAGDIRPILYEVLPVLRLKTDSETMTDYLTAIAPAAITHDLTEPGQEANNEACQFLFQRNRSVWVVDQWRTNPTRPVYEITPNFPSVKEKIGDINHGVQCGSRVASYSSTITAYEWRRVTLPDSRAGASVCRRQ